MLVHARWRRRELLARLRSKWGVAQPISGPAEARAAEAWRELDGAETCSVGLDERTWLDLDLDRVVATLDRTYTGLGQQMLYRRLRAGVAWSETPELEPLVERFGQDAELREAVSLRLHVAGRSLGEGLWIITRPGLIQVRWWYWAFPVLTMAMLASLVISPFDPRALIVVLLLLVLNLVARTATAWQVPGLLAPMRQMGSLIRTAERLVGMTGGNPEQLRMVAGDIQALRPLRRIANWVSRDAASVGEIVAGAWEYFNLMFILDANAVLLSARRLRELAPVITRVAQWVGEVDLALMVASLRAEPRAWCIPSGTDQHALHGAGVWHPLVEAPVANDVDLHPGRGVVITGANMSGKSTYLRTVGIAAVLARGINTCPAGAWRGRLFEVRSLIGRADDLSAGKSYYQVEADGVVELLRRARSPMPVLFILDELLRGTNTIERLAAGEAVLRGLLAGPPAGSSHVVMVATHDGELVAMLEGLYQPYHFQETILPEGLTFDYRRREGPASTRTAIALLAVSGAPPAVIEAAQRTAARLDEAAIWGRP